MQPLRRPAIPSPRFIVAAALSTLTTLVLGTACGTVVADGASAPSPARQSESSYSDDALPPTWASPTSEPPDAVMVDSIGREVTGILYTADWVSENGHPFVVGPAIPVPWPAPSRLADSDLRLAFPGSPPPAELIVRSYPPPEDSSGEPRGEPSVMFQCRPLQPPECSMADGAIALGGLLGQGSHIVVFASWATVNPSKDVLFRASSTWLFRLHQ